MICTVAGMLASATACGGGGSKDDAKGESASPSEKAGSGGTAKKSGGSKSKPAGGAHTVVLEVLGSGELPGIFYNAKSNGSATNVKLPWKKTAQVPSGRLLAVLASAPSQQKVTCSITVDGSVVVKKTGEVAQCRYTLKK
jgi:hypothetical protein